MGKRADNMKNLPSCSLVHDPYNDDFDCFANHSHSCEYCLCNYHETGGLYDPDTGKKVSEKRALKLYGEREVGEENIIEVIP